MRKKVHKENNETKTKTEVAEMRLQKKREQGKGKMKNKISKEVSEVIKKTLPKKVKKDIAVVDQDKDKTKIKKTQYQKKKEKKDIYKKTSLSPLVKRHPGHRLGAYQWHKLYDPSIVEKIPGLYVGGKTDVEVAVDIGIAEHTFYAWVKQYPAFSEAVKYGKSLSKTYMMKVGREAVDSERKVNDKIWHILMRNCHGFDKMTAESEAERIAREKQERIEKRTSDLLHELK